MDPDEMLRRLDQQAETDHRRRANRLIERMELEEVIAPNHEAEALIHKVRRELGLPRLRAYLDNRNT